ncbi:MAG TPA: DUF1428 domain-containing protein [Gammaproteobacteria bacterium]|nr:DUF1428 domain-containing protein [Gammaproteobacteria bacterium]
MSYIDGFVLPVSESRQTEFIDYARCFDEIFMQHGARRILECWQTDVAKGKTTDFFGAVDCTADEAVVFSWIEWADKPARDAGMASLHALMEADPRFDAARNPPPFDGKRMIYGGFRSIVERGVAAQGSYVQGFVVPVTASKQEAYRQMAEDAWSWFSEYGARRVVEAWQDDVPPGKQTDFFRAVKATEDENVVFAFIEWPSREVCNTAAGKMQSDPRMNMPRELPFDGRRLIYGAFTPVVEFDT